MSKVIPGETVTDCVAWQAPDVAGSAGGHRRSAAAQAPTAKQLEAVHQRAHEEGYALGRQEGLSAGRAQLKQLTDALSDPLAELDEEIAREVTGLALAVARQIIRRELKTDPGEVVGAVREALTALPLGAQHISVHVHPDDMDLVKDALAVPEDGQGWRILGDPTLSRGGCRVLTEYSTVDATVEARLNAIAARVLGGERERDHADGE